MQPEAIGPDSPEHNSPEAQLLAAPATMPSSEPARLALGWRIYLISVSLVFWTCIVVFFGGLFYLGSLAKNGVSGTEYVFLALIPLFLIAMILGFVNSIVLPLLISRKNPRGIWRVLAVSLLVPCLLMVILGCYLIFLNVMRPG